MTSRLQGDASACGPACLAMVCEYYGLSVDLPKLRRAAGTGSVGTDLKTLRDLARVAGIRATGARLTLTALAQLSHPAIVHYDSTHFVVVEYVDSNGVHIIDPAYGRDTLTPETFQRGWRGVALLFQTDVPVLHMDAVSSEVARHPGQSPDWIAPASHQAADVRPYYLSALDNFHKPVITVVLLGVVLQILGLAFPFFAQRIIDSAVGASDAGLLVAFVTGLTLATVGQISVVAVRDLFLVRFKLQWEHRFFQALFEHVIRLPVRALDRYTREDLVARFQANAAVRQVFSSGFVQGFLDIALVVGYIFVIFAYSRLAAFVCVAVALGLVLTTRLFSEGIRGGADQSFHATVRASGSVLETVLSLETVKLLALEDRRAAQWNERFVRALRVDGRNEARGIRFRMTCSTLTNLGQAVLYGVVGAQTLSGRITVGAFAAVTAIYVIAISRVQALSSLWIDASSLLVAFTKVNDLLREAREPGFAEPGSATHAGSADLDTSINGCPEFSTKETLRGALEIDSVSFSYGDDDRRALRNVSLRADEGQRVALVGRNGSGKSTLIKLLSLLYQEYDGKISWGGREARTLRLSTARTRIGCIPQTVHIFEGSLRDNLLLACPTASTSQLQEAISLSGLLDAFGAPERMLSLPLLSGGTNISGGQRLKVAFARLFLTRPDVVVLDEASSALDPAAERMVMSNVWNIFAGRTIIVAAHRLSTIMTSDIIAVMSDGQIVERGTHESLKDSGGLYAELLGAYIGA